VDENQISADKTEILALQAQLKQIQTAQATLGTVSTDVTRIVSQLGAFDSVWLGVVNDFQQLINMVNSTNSLITADMDTVGVHLMTYAIKYFSHIYIY